MVVLGALSLNFSRLPKNADITPHRIKKVIGLDENIFIPELSIS